MGHVRLFIFIYNATFSQLPQIGPWEGFPQASDYFDFASKNLLKSYSNQKKRAPPIIYNHGIQQAMWGESVISTRHG